MRTILLDPGHGISTPGKASPDGLFREWAGNRRLCRRILELGARAGLDCRMLFDSDADIPLSGRAALANAFPAAGTILLSVHSNAAGDGTRWHAARGFSAFVAPGASPTSRRLAEFLVQEATAAGFGGNRAIPPAGYWEQNLAICRLTACPAVLTENLFMDNRADLAILQSEAGVDALARIHVQALTRLLR